MRSLKTIPLQNVATVHPTRLRSNTGQPTTGCSATQNLSDIYTYKRLRPSNPFLNALQVVENVAAQLLSRPPGLLRALGGQHLSHRFYLHNFARR